MVDPTRLIASVTWPSGKRNRRRGPDRADRPVPHRRASRLERRTLPRRPRPRAARSGRPRGDVTPGAGRSSRQRRCSPSSRSESRALFDGAPRHRLGPPPGRRHRRVPRAPCNLPSSRRRSSRRRPCESPPAQPSDVCWSFARFRAATHRPLPRGPFADPGPSRRHRSGARRRHRPPPPTLHLSPPRPSRPFLRSHRRHPRLPRRSSPRRRSRSRRSTNPHPNPNVTTNLTTNPNPTTMEATRAAGRSPVDTTMAMIAVLAEANRIHPRVRGTRRQCRVTDIGPRAFSLDANRSIAAHPEVHETNLTAFHQRTRSRSPA